MKILIDTNIVLDLILEREPYIESAFSIFEQEAFNHRIWLIYLTAPPVPSP
ncbi:MAG TPA: hypothetical protein V6D27_03370 [Vampirovibrionales bacterium]